MSNMKLKDLSPARDLTAEEMNTIRGGVLITPAPSPSDPEGILLGRMPDQQAILRRVGEELGRVPYPPLPGTLPYPTWGPEYQPL